MLQCVFYGPNPYTRKIYVQLPTFKVILTLQNYIAKLFVRVHRVLYDVYVCIVYFVLSGLYEISVAHLVILCGIASQTLCLCATDRHNFTTPFGFGPIIMTSDYARFFYGSVFMVG